MSVSFSLVPSDRNVDLKRIGLARQWAVIYTFFVPHEIVIPFQNDCSPRTNPGNGGS